MPRQDFDKSSKWMLQHHGRAVVFLGGARDVRSCRALQAEVVQPRRLPDGLLEITCTGHEGKQLVLVEVATYPEKRVPAQVTANMMLVLQDRGVLPDVLTLVLCPRGKYRVPDNNSVRSALGWSKASFEWKVAELWKLSGDELLAAGDIGLVPWVPLTQFQGPPEVVLQRCRERIDREAGSQKGSLLAVSQVLASLRFPQPELLAIFGGRAVMIESPLIQEIVDETKQETSQQLQQANILRALTLRFGGPAAELESGVRQLVNVDQLQRLLDFAIICPSVQEFQERLRSEKPRPADAPKAKRRSRKK